MTDNTQSTEEELFKLRDTFYELTTEQLQKFGVPKGFVSNRFAVLVWKQLVTHIDAYTAQKCKEARIDGMEQAKSRVLRRTEIPADAKNPTRDYVVVLGEEIAGFIDADIAELNGPEGGETNKPGIYWNGGDLAFGFWILQRSGKLYFSGAPVKGGSWSLAEPQSTEDLKFLCGLDGSKMEKGVI